MRFGKGCFEYIHWIRTFEKHNISFNYEFMPHRFHIYECNGVKFEEQSKAYEYVRDLCSKLEEGNYETLAN